MLTIFDPLLYIKGKTQNDYPFIPSHLFSPHKNPPTVIFGMMIRAEYLKYNGLIPTFENTVGCDGSIPDDILRMIFETSKLIADRYFEWSK